MPINLAPTERTDTEQQDTNTPSIHSSAHIIIFFLISAGSWLTLSASAWAQAQAAQLYTIQGGTVQLRRSGWSAFYNSYPPTMLRKEDLLEVGVGTDAIVLCPNGRLRGPVRAGRSNVGAICPGMPTLVRPDFGVSEQWGATESSRPYMLTPWSGQVLTPTPQLEWHSSGCSTEPYQITLQQRQAGEWTDVWSMLNQQSSMAYPSDQPALEPGKLYRFQVTRGESLPAEEETGIFSLMSQTERESVQQEMAEINSLDIDSMAKTLILVEDIYPRYKLFAQGIDDLRSLINTDPDNAIIHRLLGDYYTRSGLAKPAEESYLTAIKLAVESENIEEETLANWGLGTVYGRTREADKARIYLDKAGELANQIGAADLMAGIDAELSRLPVIDK